MDKERGNCSAGHTEVGHPECYLLLLAVITAALKVTSACLHSVFDSLNSSSCLCNSASSLVVTFLLFLYRLWLSGQIMKTCMNINIISYGFMSIITVRAMHLFGIFC